MDRPMHKQTFSAWLTMRRLAIGSVFAMAAIPGSPAQAERPSLAMLDQLQPGNGSTRPRCYRRTKPLVH